MSDADQHDASATLLAAASGVVLAASVILLFYRLRRDRGGEQQAVGASVPAVAGSSGGGGKENSGADSVLVLYGTQTGTAERFAKSVSAELSSRFGDKAHVHLADVENFDFKTEAPKADILLLLFATYGDGEPTDTALDFVEWLKAEEEADSEPLLGKAYCVFGLGNRQYEHFNATGKQLDKSLAKLGADRLAPLGLGDDDDCIEEDLEKWSAALWAALSRRLGGGGDGGAGQPRGPLAYEADVVDAGAGAALLDMHAGGKVSRGRVAEVRRPPTRTRPHPMTLPQQ